MNTEGLIPHQALVVTNTTLETLFVAHLLCDVCAMQPWTTTGKYHWAALLCADCKSNEPDDSTD